MSRKAHVPEWTIQKLGQAEVELARGGTVGAVCKQMGIAEQTHYQWRAALSAAGDRSESDTLAFTAQPSMDRFLVDGGLNRAHQADRRSAPNDLAKQRHQRHAGCHCRPLGVMLTLGDGAGRP